MAHTTRRDPHGYCSGLAGSNVAIVLFGCSKRALASMLNRSNCHRFSSGPGLLPPDTCRGPPQTSAGSAKSRTRRSHPCARWHGRYLLLTCRKRDLLSCRSSSCSFGVAAQMHLGLSYRIWRRQPAVKRVGITCRAIREPTTSSLVTRASLSRKGPARLFAGALTGIASEAKIRRLKDR